MNATETFRCKLAKHMEEHPDFSWRALSRESGVSKTHILNFMSGARHDMTLTYAEAIAQAIGKTLSEMIE